MSRPKTITSCHPDLDHFAKGLCRDCYLRDYYSNPVNKERNKISNKKNYDSKKAAYIERSNIYHRQHPEVMLITSAKIRAKKKGLPFDLKTSDITIPSICPVLGIPLIPLSGKFAHNSPSIDRIDNSKGYTKDNIIVVSFRANSLKKDATTEELKMVSDFYNTLQSTLTDGNAVKRNN